MQSTEVTHGTIHSYAKLRCRCAQCREANRARMAEYRVKKVGAHPKPEPDGYRAMHNRLRRLRGKASQYACEICGGTAADWALDNTSPRRRRNAGKGIMLMWSDRMDDYRPLCRPCHRSYDSASARGSALRVKDKSKQAKAKRQIGRCGNGHDLTLDNALRERSNRAPECVECSRERVRRYKERVRLAATGRMVTPL